MNIEIHRLTLRNTFLILPEGGTPPAPLATANAEPFKRLRLTPGEDRAGMDVDAVLGDIERQGWAVVGAAVVIDVK